MQQSESSSKKKNPLIPLVIDRRRWLRGEGGLVSALYRDSDRKMCCLGFACLASGLRVADIRNKALPSALMHPPMWAHDCSVSQAMHENDWLAREPVIAALLEKLGFAVRFTN